ncbi:MAG: hypothetical protein ACJ78Q_19190 [Chloroflexia bacterium]
MIRVRRHRGLRATGSFVVVALVLVMVAGCARLTSVDPQGQPAPYDVGVKIDPVTLNPPQTGTLTFFVTDTSTGKPVTEFDPVSGALMHTVLISRDMQNFRHSYTQSLVDDAASLFTYFPEFSKYYAYSLFKPAGKNLQTFKTLITTGDVQGSEPDLVEDTNLTKTKGWLTFHLLKENSPIKKGKPTQMVFNVTERGKPVQALWPYLGAPGQLWIIGEDGNDFAHLEGASEAHVLPQATPESSEPSSSTTTGGTGAGGTGAGGTRSGEAGTPVPVSTEPPPTFAPGLSAALATAAAAPTQQLAPVQQTPLAGLSTPEVVPGTSYGPNIAFTHTFPRAGLYKMWLEVLYRDQVVLADYVVRVTE